MTNENLQQLKIDKSIPAPSYSGRRGRIVWIAGVLLVLLFLALWIWSRQGVEVELATVAHVYPTQTFTLLNASGYVVAGRKAAVASKITGRLEWLGVEEGSRVKAGQLLARLESRDLASLLEQSRAAAQVSRSSLDQVQAELDDASRNYERQKTLLGQGITARAEYDQAEARHRRAVAAVAAARSSIRVAEAQAHGAGINLEYANIRAPFDGVVLSKSADVGDIITPLGAAANAKAAVVSIADLASLEIEADVSESSLAQVKAGQPCEVTLDALPNARFRALVHTIVPTADRSKASVMVKVRFVDKDPRILPEMSAKVAFLSREATKADQQPRIAVNPAVVAGQGATAHVYRIQDGKAHKVPVSVGQKLGDLLEVGGLQPGDKLVLKPLERMRDGLRVKVPEK